RFWTHSGGIVRLASPEAWRAYCEDGSARATMNFRIEDRRVITETRVQTFGPNARRRFRLYWTLVGPFSGLIRRAFLRRSEEICSHGGHGRTRNVSCSNR